MTVNHVQFDGAMIEENDIVKEDGCKNTIYCHVEHHNNDLPNNIMCFRTITSDFLKGSFFMIVAVWFLLLIVDKFWPERFKVCWLT